MNIDNDLPWPSIGSECICIHDQPWLDELIGLWGERILIEVSGPKFMQQYKVIRMQINRLDDLGHEQAIGFAEFPGYYCQCNFRPVIKIKDEETIQATEPVA